MSESARRTYHVLIFLDAVDGKEAEFHDWYENVHLDDVLRTAGFRAAQRFGYGTGVGAPAPTSHLAIYETEGESHEEVLNRLNSTRDQRPLSDSIDASNLAMWVFDELGRQHTV